MSYQALYRVWRPKRLEDVAGQNHITKTLQNALIQQKVAHAYLFSGPRGTGKTSAAKIMAKAVNCEHAPVAEPCDTCDACKGIQSGAVVDVIEIDAASNNGVDEIRYIRDNVIAAPRDVKYKVYIIDEVHMLSTGAFNALLKTLEEPPAHAIFILATTESHKIPLTIISRTQRFDFKRIGPETLIKRMSYILEQVEAECEEDALHLISRVAEGGMRDALSLLDQALSFSEDNTIRTEDVLAITGAVSQGFLADAVEAIIDGDAEKAVQAADALIREGKDPLRFMEDLIYYLRDLMLYKTAPSLNTLLDRVQADDAFVSMAERVESAWVYDSIERLHGELREMKGSSHPKIFLEMALIHAAKAGGGTNVPALDQGEVSQLKEQLSQLQKELHSVKTQSPAASGEEQHQKTPPKRRPQPTAQNGASVKQATRMLQQASKEERAKIESKWADVLRTIKQESVPASAWINDAKPVAASTDALILVFQNEMHRGMIDDKFRTLTERAIASNNDHSYQIITLLNHQWEELKSNFRSNQSDEDQNSTSETEQAEVKEEEDRLITEAHKLVGEEFVHVIDDSPSNS
ncbi:DNA polymerase III subunit gamma/tau [Geomicrobium sediminis]|uniref:DNA-directed DNA polymerase n=1 Tax=Geomicrobium sediminis TaxID=1347788 RepID=A0ABS2PK61_9BACL|nr:DNA polymerase III subunit gamma/tau [Geomicrobium sediminis]MBM7635203.1 DNA polymerase-3 subunit gamma/tau [Geomicrobium sediminis]